jgi:hypothetical protein
LSSLRAHLCSARAGDAVPRNFVSANGDFNSSAIAPDFYQAQIGSGSFRAAIIAAAEFEFVSFVFHIYFSFSISVAGQLFLKNETTINKIQIAVKACQNVICGPLKGGARLFHSIFRSHAVSGVKPL